LLHGTYLLANELRRALERAPDPVSLGTVVTKCHCPLLAPTLFFKASIAARANCFYAALSPKACVFKIKI
jgi:hypothetical protein